MGVAHNNFRFVHDWGFGRMCDLRLYDDDSRVDVKGKALSRCLVPRGLFNWINCIIAQNGGADND